MADETLIEHIFQHLQQNACLCAVQQWQFFVLPGAKQYGLDWCEGIVINASNLLRLHDLFESAQFTPFAQCFKGALGGAPAH